MKFSEYEMPMSYRMFHALIHSDGSELTDQDYESLTAFEEKYGPRFTLEYLGGENYLTKCEITGQNEMCIDVAVHVQTLEPHEKEPMINWLINGLD